MAETVKPLNQVALQSPIIFHRINMECSLGFVRTPSTTVSPSFTYASKKPKKNGTLTLRAQFNGENDSTLQAAIHGASLRFQETHRPEPLFVDPFAGCFVRPNVPNVQMDFKKYSQHYCIATRFIDDKLLRTVNHSDGLKQVVLLTDGMDTRPYRLNWPTSTILFDVSPERIFRQSAKNLAGVGTKVPRSCLFLHVPMESTSIQQSLCAEGFNGNRPSIWAIQGLPVMGLASFEELLFTVSSLAANGSLFLGELPSWLTETEVGMKPSTKKWMDKLFMSNGFRVDIISYAEVARSLGKELAPGRHKNILFVAEQLRFSDDQADVWRREFQRIEEEGDEEGFEEL